MSHQPIENFSANTAVESQDRSHLLDPSLYSRPTLPNLDRATSKPMLAQTIDFAEHGDIFKSEQITKAKPADAFTSLYKKMPGVTEYYEGRVKEWVDSIPADVRQKMISGNIKILVVSKATQVDPNADTEQARGYEPGIKVSMLPGFYSKSLNALVLVQNRDLKPAERQSQTVQGSSSQDYSFSNFDKRVAWHELGHSIDHQQKDLSATSSEFVQAYRADIAKLLAKPPVAPELQYYTTNSRQTEAGARSEIFAELFAVEHLKNHYSKSEQPINAADLKEASFSNTLAVLRKRGWL